MKRRFAAFLFLSVSVCLIAQNKGSTPDGAWSSRSDEILQTVENADVKAAGDTLLLRREDTHAPVKMSFASCQGLGVQRDHDQWWVLPISAPGARIDANQGMWVLPLDEKSKQHSWHIQLQDSKASAIETGEGLTVLLDADSAVVSKSEARPHSDAFGHRFSLKIADGGALEDALAGFYWGTMLPSVVEKTMAANFPYSSGYVLSTLNVSSYAGSYPAVDHEFQIKGRLAMGSELDLDVVKRMIELQLHLMNDDPERLYRAPTSVQPDGRREYHIRRNSRDNKQNAAMFPLTGNIEVMEEAWHYYEARKDAAWLRRNIANLENAAGWTLKSMDQYGRVWSDVYYEDQVIKDGRVTQAQAFAAYSFGLLASMEKTLGRQAKATYYAGISKQIADALIRPLPMGYWDEKSERFVDWVDRDGQVHDHIHLLANALPVTFGYATAAQANAVRRLIDKNAGQFERFPSFLSADIAAYNDSEIGSGGPYDLSAAGRYWYWDAAFRESQTEDELLLHQLLAVAAEGAKHNYLMGERYDMDYVYYIDGKNAHGAEKYYEYPNVYTAVLIAKYLGLTIPADADVSVAPHIHGYGEVEFGIPEYALRYGYEKDGFVLANLSEKPRRFSVDLSAIGGKGSHYQLQSKARKGIVGARSYVTLSTHEEAHWIREP